MRTIWKYPLSLIGAPQAHQIPKGAQVRFVGGNPRVSGMAVWFEVLDSDAETEEQKFLLQGTGDEIPEGAEYLGSVPDGEFIWHIFRIP